MCIIYYDVALSEKRKKCLNKIHIKLLAKHPQAHILARLLNRRTMNQQPFKLWPRFFFLFWGGHVKLIYFPLSNTGDFNISGLRPTGSGGIKCKPKRLAQTCSKITKTCERDTLLSLWYSYIHAVILTDLRTQGRRSVCWESDDNIVDIMWMKVEKEL